MLFIWHYQAEDTFSLLLNFISENGYEICGYAYKEEWVFENGRDLRDRSASGTRQANRSHIFRRMQVRGTFHESF